MTEFDRYQNSGKVFLGFLLFGVFLLHSIATILKLKKTEFGAKVSLNPNSIAS